LFLYDPLSVFVGGFVLFFFALTFIYSLGYFPRKREGWLAYNLNLIFTLLASLGIVFANNLILLAVFWGFAGLTLYLLIGFGQKDRTPATAKKAFIIIGGTDAFMLLGIAFIWSLTGSLDITRLQVPLNNHVAIWAYLCLGAAALAKAGAMPFHTWVPDTAEDAPTPVVAFLPASLDKLVGIYFLARISMDVFVMSSGMNTLLMFLGSLTIIAAVMMALVQHDFKRLLGYHAVSQVGYMILGIGTANPIGIAGGLFHMLNNAIYKSCLFLSGGVVEKKVGTTDLDKLGGLAKTLPITFAAFLVSALAISGVPPLNGFASKWMIYQGIIDAGKAGGNLWIIWLMAAMAGSALTLASFMKMAHAIFLGQPSATTKAIAQKRDEAGPLMLIPIVTLAVLSVLFGVFVYSLVVKPFLAPALGVLSFSGIWYANLAAGLLVIAVLAGLGIYCLGTIAKPRTTKIFIGGEDAEKNPQMRLSGTEFYNSIQEIGILKLIYRMAERKVFDIYECGIKLTFGFNRILSHLHNGVLSTYLSWSLLGMGILFVLIMLAR